MARQTLILRNLPLVRSIVGKILKPRPHLRPSTSESLAGAALTWEDLLHEGTIGLAEALDRYDFSYSDLVQRSESEPSTRPKGARLGTYATYWIRARILRAINLREHAFRFPERTLQASHRLVKAAKELGLDWDAVVGLGEDQEVRDDSSSLVVIWQ